MEGWSGRVRRALPTRERLSGLRWFGRIFGRDELWLLDRRSVSRGIALGLFIAPLLPLGHMFLAAIVAVPLRANVLAAIAATWVINPLTIAPFYYFAYRIGAWLLRIDGASSEPARMATTWLATIMETTVPAALGTLILAATMSGLGYVLSLGALSVRWARHG